MISFILYMSTIKVKSNITRYNLIPPTLFILFMSQPWGLSGIQKSIHYYLLALVSICIKLIYQSIRIIS